MPNNSRAMLLIAIVLVALTSVPIEGANKEHQQMMADLRILQQQNQMLQAQVSALSEALKSVSSRQEDQTGANRRAYADQKLLVENVMTEIRTVREQTSEANVRLQTISQEVNAVRELRVGVAGVPAGASPADVPTTGGVAQAPTSQLPPVMLNPGQSPQRMFDTALGDYYAGNFSLALSGFESCIKSFPKAAVAADAQYYIGETRYVGGQFREAVAAYDSVIANYPSSKTLPDAYFKRGKALASLDLNQQARESYEFAVKNYPDTDAGRLAIQALAQMGPIRK